MCVGQQPRRETIAVQSLIIKAGNWDIEPHLSGWEETRASVWGWEILIRYAYDLLWLAHWAQESVSWRQFGLCSSLELPSVTGLGWLSLSPWQTSCMTEFSLVDWGLFFCTYGTVKGSCSLLCLSGKWVQCTQPSWSHWVGCFPHLATPSSHWGTSTLMLPTTVRPGGVWLEGMACLILSWCGSHRLSITIFKHKDVPGVCCGSMGCLGHWTPPGLVFFIDSVHHFFRQNF